MPDASVVQITVWLDDEQNVEILANTAITSGSGAIIEPCSDAMNFSRTKVAQGASGSDMRSLLQDICDKLNAALSKSDKTIPICTSGPKIINCPAAKS
jgi:hypothetical protein